MGGAVRESAGAAGQHEVGRWVVECGSRDGLDLQLVLEEAVLVGERVVVDVHVLGEHPVTQVAFEVAGVRSAHELLEQTGAGGAAEQAVVVLRDVVADHNYLLHARPCNLNMKLKACAVYCTGERLSM